MQDLTKPFIHGINYSASLTFSEELINTEYMALSTMTVESIRKHHLPRLPTSQTFTCGMLIAVLTWSIAVTTAPTSAWIPVVPRSSMLILPSPVEAYNVCRVHSDRSYWCHLSSSKRYGWLSMSAANEDEENIDGAELAAAFFRTAQSKGINIDSNDLLYEDDEDDNDADDDEEEEDDEIEPNIPQGAINAFLGYDTGNVGEKLAGNVTLTNDQLYSEVKERVLESAGGFLSFVKSATDDEEDEDDEDSKLISSTNKPYVVPTTVPDSELTAGEVIILVLEVLRNNDIPTINKGVEILFGYSSPGSQIKNEIGLTPKEYAEFLKETEYKVLFTHAGPIHIDKADYSFDGKKAFFAARLQTAIDSPLDTVSVNFILSTTGREDDACWLIDSMLIRPESMRRRRRK